MIPASFNSCHLVSIWLNSDGIDDDGSTTSACANGAPPGGSSLTNCWVTYWSAALTSCNIEGVVSCCSVIGGGGSIGFNIDFPFFFDSLTVSSFYDTGAGGKN
jgi:hypothetical protein